MTLTGVRRKSTIRHSLPTPHLIKPEHHRRDTSGISSPRSLQSLTSPPSSLVPTPPPLPRLTVITTTREDGSPQTIIKTTTTTTAASDSTKSTPTYASDVKTNSSSNNGAGAGVGGNGGSPGSILVPKPSGNGDFSVAEFGERKHKKSKKHKRHSSKEGHHRHSGDGDSLHRSVSFHDSVKPPKLVIRHRSSEFGGTQTSELFVDTMETSPGPPPPPLSAPFSTKLSPRPPHSDSLSGSSPVNANEDNTNGSGNALKSTKNCDLQSIYPSNDRSRGQTASRSTVSPASMDLGPCPLPNVQEWSTDDVYNYLLSKDPSLLDVASLFRQQEIDGPALLLVDMDTMRTLLNLKIGPALKVDDILCRLKRGLL